MNPDSFQTFWPINTLLCVQKLPDNARRRGREAQGSRNPGGRPRSPPPRLRPRPRLQRSTPPPAQACCRPLILRWLHPRRRDVRGRHDDDDASWGRLRHHQRPARLQTVRERPRQAPCAWEQDDCPAPQHHRGPPGDVCDDAAVRPVPARHRGPSRTPSHVPGSPRPQRRPERLYHRQRGGACDGAWAWERPRRARRRSSP